MKYKLVVSNDAQDFEDQVNQLLDLGYRLVGNLVHVMHWNLDVFIWEQYSQGMTKEGNHDQAS